MNQIKQNGNGYEQKIFDYIRNNPGCSKQDVVRGMNRIPSRITVLNILRNLNQKKTIHAIKKSNGQLYQLYINRNDLAASLQTNLDDFENAYFLLLQKAKDRLKEKRRLAGKTITQNDANADFIAILTYMLWIYEDIVKACLMKALTWPEKTNNDSETLSELYRILFSRLAKMQLKLSNALPTKSLVLLATKTMIVRSLEFPQHIESTLNYCKEYNLFKEAVVTVDAIWNITRDLFYEGYRDFYKQYNVDNVKDWRELLELRKQHPDLRDTMDKMRNSFILGLDNVKASKDVL